MSLHDNSKFKYIDSKDNCLRFKLFKEEIEARFYVLEEDIIRVLFMEEDELKINKTWSVAPGLDDIPFEGRDRLDNSLFSLPDYKHQVEDNQVIIKTKELKATINLDGFKISWYARYNGQWFNFANDRKTQAYNLNYWDDKKYHYLKRNKDEQYFGLGEKAGEIDRYGKRYRMLTIDAMGYNAQSTDPLYKHIPFYITRNKNNGYAFGIFYDNMAESVFDMGAELDQYHGLYRYYMAESGDLDYYIISGPSIKKVTEKFSWLTGKTNFSPKWSLGYSGSTMSYTDSPDAQKELTNFINDCEHYDIPCDSFQLSSGYTSIDDKRYVFNWNYSKIPEPKKMVQTFKDNGIKLCANIKPCLLIDHPRYEEAIKKDLFIKNNNNQVEVSQFWDNPGSYLDFTNQETIDWWKNNVKEKLLKFGINSTWNDNNEYEIWSDDAYAAGFGDQINMQLIRPLQSLLMMKASFEAQKEFASDKRPYLISRSGCPGMQRYVQTWSGDNYTSWETLKYNIKMGLGLTLSGIYNFGHDVGGFAGPAPEAELLVRWVQNGIFHPRFTIHSWNDDQSANEPWMYPEVVDLIRDAIKFREKIKPYLYTLLYQSHADFKPIIRPVFYEFADDEKTFDQDLEFMLGKYMLIANVIEKGVTSRELYLPENNAWYNYNKSEVYQGGSKITVSVSLASIPLFIREGAIIPVNDQEISFNSAKEVERGFMIYPYLDSGEEEYYLFEDDGESYGYLDDEYKKIKFNLKCSSEKISLQIKIEGSYNLPYKQIKLHFPETEKRKICINKKQISLDQNNDISLSIKSLE
ncbi:MAG: TIM-barrel domain-containing protein [Bacillota bacterium]